MIQRQSWLIRLHRVRYVLLSGIARFFRLNRLVVSGSQDSQPANLVRKRVSWVEFNSLRAVLEGTFIVAKEVCCKSRQAMEQWRKRLQQQRDIDFRMLDVRIDSV
jgi:hypothetical protein